jgi:hypothetical protein
MTKYRTAILFTLALAGCGGNDSSGGNQGGMSGAAGAGVGGSAGSDAQGGQSGGGGSSGSDCGCLRGAYFPVCGVDGNTYDATCGRDCVPVSIQCNGACPCGGAGGSGGSAAGSGGAAGSTGGASAGAGAAGMSGAGAGAGGAGILTCGDETCGENQYCRAGCNGTGGPPGPPHCTDLPPECVGNATCECICGSTAIFCTPGETAIQCGCA